ncbi:MAG: SDR family NAD(P)-dependent oxidoreductase [Gammaproteobacteria bacterium]|nr:SDR family NAD(P)-dependent oxidoreductase [Gammaproteobacteria bacterium]
MPSENKVALVTGGAQRLGAEICRRLHAAGYSIALHYRHSELAAGELASELNALRPESCRSYREAPFFLLHHRAGTGSGWGSEPEWLTLRGRALRGEIVYRYW